MLFMSETQGKLDMYELPLMEVRERPVTVMKRDLVIGDQVFDLDTMWDNLVDICDGDIWFPERENDEYAKYLKDNDIIDGYGSQRWLTPVRKGDNFDKFYKAISDLVYGNTSN